MDKGSSGKLLLKRLKKHLESRREPYIGQHRMSVIKMIQQQIRRLERIEDNLYDDKLAGILDEQNYARRVASIQDELTILRQRLERLAEYAVVASNKKEPTTLRDMYTGESKNGKRRIIQELFKLKCLAGHVEFQLVDN